MKVLFIGDIVGKPGRRAVRELLPVLRQQFQPDLVIANGENAAGGIGITPKVADELYGLGIDFLTMGNHVWDKKEAVSFLDEEPRIIRPLNYPPGTPGRGSATVISRNGVKVGIINVAGRVFSPISVDCPFRLALAEAARLKTETPILVVDFHAEATSEKVALGWYLDGEVSAVIGTHTHVQTADARILPRSTAYITDVGMTGPMNSVIGVSTELIIQRFLTQMPVKFQVAKGPAQVSGVSIDIDLRGRATEIEPFVRIYGDEE